MKLNPMNILFGTDRNKKPPVLLAVTPPRTGERTLLGVENLLQSIAVPEPFSLEIVGHMDGVTLMARCQATRVQSSRRRRAFKFSTASHSFAFSSSDRSTGLEARFVAKTGANGAGCGTGEPRKAPRRSNYAAPSQHNGRIGTYRPYLFPPTGR